MTKKEIAQIVNQRLQDERLDEDITFRVEEDDVIVNNGETTRVLVRSSRLAERLSHLYWFLSDMHEVIEQKDGLSLMLMVGKTFADAESVPLRSSVLSEQNLVNA